LAKVFRERGDISIDKVAATVARTAVVLWRRASAILDLNSAEAWIPKSTWRQIDLKLKLITHEHTENACTSGYCENDLLMFALKLKDCLVHDDESIV